MFGLLKKFKSSFSKTTKSLFGSIGGIFGRKTLDDASIEELEEALYNADFGVETTTEIIEEIKAAYKKDKELHGSDAAKIGATILKRVLEGSEGVYTTAQSTDENKQLKKPDVICLIGVNGSGKTTSSAKLAYHFNNANKSVLLGACDTFRAAANEQIKAWSERLKIDLISSHHGADAAAVAYDAYQAAKSRGKDILILDTAGRLHNKTNLMEELKKLKRVLQKHDPDAPQHRWLVLDGSLGSNSIEQAKVFYEAFDLTGLIITKLDGTSRGGALVGIYRSLGIPIYFVGLGEAPEDLQTFSVENYVNAIFDIKE